MHVVTQWQYTNLRITWISATSLVKQATWPALLIWTPYIVHNSWIWGGKNSRWGKKNSGLDGAVRAGILHWGWFLGRGMMFSCVRNKKIRVWRHWNQQIQVNSENVMILEKWPFSTMIFIGFHWFSLFFIDFRRRDWSLLKNQHNIGIDRIFLVPVASHPEFFVSNTGIHHTSA